ncbi:MAG: 2-C-methyl-D-erythritol 4-phosphate cytidylyltransferase, partial [Alphaproteobacteria bacterium]
MTTPQHIIHGRPLHVLIAAAGQGDRFGGSLPKQYSLLHGKSLLRHTLDAFIHHIKPASLRVIINPEHSELYHAAVTGLSLPEPIYGSNERKSSVYNGLSSISDAKDDDIILVHDAVRPLIAPAEITTVIAKALETGAASLACPVTDTLRNTSGETISRDGLWAVQTPQAFRYDLLKKAHLSSLQATDDAGLVIALGHPVAMVKGSRSNIKITFPDDMIMAERLMTKNYTVRTGLGFDVHAFEKSDKNRPLMLGGIKVDHPFGLAGHSDADVALHAITDALLGALAEGDIGQHFPPSNPDYKNLASDIFLKRARAIADEKSAMIQNIDLTIICESPKIGPYREAMQTRIAEILGLSPAQVGVKATTTEQLGFTGRGEGIAAQAIATVKIPE